MSDVADGREAAVTGQDVGGTPLLSVESLSKSYATARGDLHILTGVDMTVEPGEVVAVTGESGTGKSTLLHLIGALDRPDGGRVLFQGESVFDKDDEALSRFRNDHIGFIFQFHHLLPEFTALENVMMPALIRGDRAGRVRGRADELLGRVGLSERSDHRPAELSGGEKQRVAVARALMNDPELVLADEPTGNLDEKTADSLHREMIRLSREVRQTFVIVTHNPQFATMADRVLQLENGTLTPA